MSEKIGYDELLESRVKQLQAIDERLEAMLRTKPDILHKAIRDLRNDIASMIRVAQAESDAF